MHGWLTVCAVLLQEDISSVLRVSRESCYIAYGAEHAYMYNRTMALDCRRLSAGDSIVHVELAASTGSIMVAFL